MRLLGHPCYFDAIMHLFCQSSSIVLHYGDQLLTVAVGFSRPMCVWWPGFALTKVSHRHHVAFQCMWYKALSNSNHLLFGAPPYVSTRVQHTLAAGTAHPLEFEVYNISICKMFYIGSNSYME